MTITLTDKEWEELCDESIQSDSYNSVSGTAEKFYELPKQCVEGYGKLIELYPELWLTLEDGEFHDDTLIQHSSKEHTLHFDVWLSVKRLHLITSNLGKVIRLSVVEEFKIKVFHRPQKINVLLVLVS